MAIVSECTDHTCHSQHHVLWYLFRQPTTTVLLEFTYEFDIQEKACFSRSRGGGGGGEFNRPVQGWGSTCRFGARSECGHQPNSPARLSLTTVGGGTTPLCYSTSHTQAKRRFVETVQFTTTHSSSGEAIGVVEMAVRVVAPVVMAEVVEAFRAMQPLVG